MRYSAFSDSVDTFRNQTLENRLKNGHMNFKNLQSVSFIKLECVLIENIGLTYTKKADF